MSTGDAWPNFKLTIGELFPASDLVAQWVFTLNSVAEDVQLSLRPLKTSNELREHVYFYRALITRLYEARRLIESRAKYKEIADFTGNGLAFLGVDLVKAYSRAGTGDPSEVEQLYAESRHRDVHYPRVGEPELEGLLGDYRNFPARIEVVDTKGQITLESQWVTVVRVQDALGAVPWDPTILERMRERERATTAIATAWIMANFILTIIYTRQRGIPLERVIDDPAKLRSATEPRSRENLA